MSPSAEDRDRERSWCSRVAAARRRGDHLAVFDLAAAGLADCPEALPLHHAAILALARAGATREARGRFDRLAETGRLDAVADSRLALDFAALDGRLYKDAWSRSSGEAARGHASRSADAYAAAFARFGDPYPAVNAATMSLAAGRPADAARLARAALSLAGRGAPDYWTAVTVAEAALLLDDLPTARAALRQAAGATGAGLDAVAATRRQLAVAARLSGADAALIEALPPPQVLYWLDDAAGPTAGRRDVSESRDGPGIVFGPVVDAADVERALHVLDRGFELNLVLPCETEAWLDALPPTEAAAAAPRLTAALRGAANVLVVTREGNPRDPAALHLCRLQVRGLALLRAANFVTAARRLLWMDRGAGLPGTGLDGGAETVPAATPPDGERIPRAIVFADIRGYSRLRESLQLVVVDRLVDAFADVLAACGGVDRASTAGDGLHVVLSDVQAAARCCFGLRDAMSPEIVAGLGLPPDLGLRVGAHVGPVYRRFDRVIGQDNFHGSEVIRAARIEPVTPVGEIFVTEQFAATLAAGAPSGISCDYAGRQAMAKGFGECRMYAMHRRAE